MRETSNVRKFDVLNVKSESSRSAYYFPYIGRKHLPLRDKSKREVDKVFLYKFYTPYVVRFSAYAV